MQVRHLRRLTVVTLLCAGHFATADSPQSFAKLPTHYAAMFKLHNAWIYDVALTEWNYAKIDPDTPQPWPKTTKHFTIACRVSRVQSFPTTVVSQVTCEHNDKDEDLKTDRLFNVPGIYRADATGLYRLALSRFPTAAEDVVGNDEGPALIAAEPKASRVVTLDDFFKANLIIGVRKRRGAWCSYEDTSEFADGGLVSVCFRNGIASGESNVGNELRHLVWRTRAAKPTASSVFTDLTPRSCREVVDYSDPNDTPYLKCRGVDNVGLIVRHVDAGRKSIDVVDRSQQVHPLNYQHVVTLGMFSLDPNVEWRVAPNGLPVALITRVLAREDHNYPERVTRRYFAIAKITPNEVCVTDRIVAGTRSEVDVRRVADTAQNRPCALRLRHDAPRSRRSMIR